MNDKNNICRVCGRAYESNISGIACQHCSKDARLYTKRDSGRSCLNCSEKIEAKGNNEFCSDSCSEEYHDSLSIIAYCKNCLEQFKPKKSNIQFCDRECKTEFYDDIKTSGHMRRELEKAWNEVRRYMIQRSVKSMMRFVDEMIDTEMYDSDNE